MAEEAYQSFFGDSMAFNPQYQHPGQSSYQVDYDLLPLSYQNLVCISLRLERLALKDESEGQTS